MHEADDGVVDQINPERRSRQVLNRQWHLLDAFSRHANQTQCHQPSRRGGCDRQTKRRSERGIFRCHLQLVQLPTTQRDRRDQQASRGDNHSLSEKLRPNQTSIVVSQDQSAGEECSTVNPFAWHGCKVVLKAPNDFRAKGQHSDADHKQQERESFDFRKLVCEVTLGDAFNQ